jgi:ATP-dependent DNA ligase
MASSRSFPLLLGDAVGGAVKQWSAKVAEEADGAAAVVTIQFGQQGGKLQTTERRYTAGKNAGKSNATTPYQQAVLETRRKWLNKLKKQGYRRAEAAGEGEAGEREAGDEAAGEAGDEAAGQAAGEAADPEAAGQAAGEAADPEAAGIDEQDDVEPASAKRRRVSTALLPMLAKAFDPSKVGNKRAKPIHFPCLAQPKLDGLRCLIYWDPASRSPIAQSRVGGKFTTVGHILDELRPVFEAWDEPARGGGLVLDGELFTIDMPFEALAGALKRKNDSPVVQAAFHAYDMFILREGKALPTPCEERIETLRSLLAGLLVSVKVVDTRRCESVEEMRALFAEFTAAGYEGIMLRNLAAPYLVGHRSADLQKHKEFSEEEFEIVGFAEAEGRDAGTVVFVCRANLCDPESNLRLTFSVRPRGSFEHRASLLRDAPDLVARKAKLTVVYQELSAHNVPRFPVGKDVRDGQY